MIIFSQQKYKIKINEMSRAMTKPKHNGFATSRAV
jgi:hypothetical protein